MTTPHMSGVQRAAYVPIRMPARHVPMENDWTSLSEVRRLLKYDGHCSANMHDPTFRRRRLQAGRSLFSMGQEFGGLYVVRSGTLKTVVTHQEGTEHVISFSMQGDLLGAEGVCEHHYWCETFALSDCEVIRLPADDYFSPGRAGDGIERMICWAISREVGRRQSAYAITHAAKSEVRVARFLVEQSERHAALGYSPTRFALTMTRRDIGAYLSVTLETVSRALSALHQLHIIEVANREITIHSLDALRAFEG